MKWCQQHTFKWFSKTIRIRQYQNVFILDCIGAKVDGGDGDNCSRKTCKAPVISSPSTIQHPASCRSDAIPVAQPSVYFHIFTVTLTNFMILLCLVLNSLINPQQTSTVSSKDPYYIIPSIKAKLCRKNRLMRAGQIEEANSLAQQISKDCQPL